GGGAYVVQSGGRAGTRPGSPRGSRAATRRAHGKRSTGGPHSRMVGGRRNGRVGPSNGAETTACMCSPDLGRVFGQTERRHATVGSERNLRHLATHTGMEGAARAGKVSRIWKTNSVRT